MKFSLHINQKGFTLVELLVVIAVLGVLAAGVLVAINPLEQLARGRDVSKKTAITELGRALNTYMTTQNALPDGDDGFATVLQNAGEIRVVPSNPAQNGCSVGTATTLAGDQGGYCYLKDANNNYVVYAEAESNSEELVAGGGNNCPTGQTPYIIYSSSEGRTGLKCVETVTAAETGLN